MTNLLIKQYKTKPKALKTIEILEKHLSALFDSIVEIGDILNIEQASGYKLDLVGHHVGASRVLKNSMKKKYFGFVEHDGEAFGVGKFYRSGDNYLDDFSLDDSDFRILIKLKIAKNYQNGTLEDLLDKFIFAFGEDERLNIHDNLNMSMSLNLPKETLSDFLLDYILKNDLLPRPIGVHYYKIKLISKQSFGTRENIQNRGFNEGILAREYKNENI